MGLSFPKRSPRPERTETPAQRRASKIATPDLASWAEQALNGLGRALSDYRRSGDSKELEEAEVGAEALLAVIQELRRRG